MNGRVRPAVNGRATDGGIRLPGDPMPDCAKQWTRLPGSMFGSPAIYRRAYRDPLHHAFTCRNASYKIIPTEVAKFKLRTTSCIIGIV